MNRFELSEAINALYSIPSDIPRDQWVKIGMAFHSSGGDLETFSKWSSAAPSYNYKDCASTWKSFKFKRGGISGGTLFFEANKYKSNSYESAKKLIHNEFAGSPQQEVLKSKANEIWNRSLPANPYIVCAPKVPTKLSAYADPLKTMVELTGVELTKLYRPKPLGNEKFANSKSAIGKCL